MEKKEEIHQSRISSKVRGGFFTYRAGGENELIYPESVNIASNI